jgi:hypothetical protein
MNVKEYRQRMEAQLGNAAPPPGLDSAAPPPQQGWADAIRQLADATLDTETRKNMLHVLQAGTFQGSQFAPFRAEYLQALRTAATDADPELRRLALDVLANFKDEFARQKLTEGLRGTGEELLPPAAALGLLARDDHASAGAIAGELLAKSTDPHTRAQAVRVLASDPGAKALLTEVMKDKAEFREVRRASAVALKALDAQAFLDGARDILSDESDYKDIKATITGALKRAGADASGEGSASGSDLPE